MERRYLPVIAIALVAASCGTAAGAPTTTANLGGDGLPVQAAGENFGHTPGPLTATFNLEQNGCWTADAGGGPQLVVFPAGYAKPLDNGLVMVGADGTTVVSGRRYAGIGGAAAVDGVPGVPDGYWGNYLAFCDPGASLLLVFDTLSDPGGTG
jgi:hypothetical protein